MVHILLFTTSSDSSVHKLGTPLLLLIAGLVRDRLYQFCNKLYFVFAMLITSWQDRKQRRRSTIFILFISAIFFPIILSVMAAAAVLSAPLLPLFTLPVFFIAFPRLQRFWPEAVGASANICSDTVYYRQFAPAFAQALRRGFANGSLGKCADFEWIALNYCV